MASPSVRSRAKSTTPADLRGARDISYAGTCTNLRAATVGFRGEGDAWHAMPVQQCPDGRISVKIAYVSGGPTGLRFGPLVKLRNPEHHVTICGRGGGESGHDLEASSYRSMRQFRGTSQGR